MYLLNLFRSWFNENVAEFDREGLSREVIAQKAFIAGFNAAQQSFAPDVATELRLNDCEVDPEKLPGKYADE